MSDRDVFPAFQEKGRLMDNPICEFCEKEISPGDGYIDLKTGIRWHLLCREAVDLLTQYPEKVKKVLKI